ncbi:Hsp20/alpha crystallin family protein [Streptococcus chenjunshii]|nr:Hsp20/alpha crystallin family protein [Streptococcus chenjunshii]
MKMLTPKLFSDGLLDNWFDDVSKEFTNIRRSLSKNVGREMLMDVKDKKDHYDVEIDLPGVKKENITIELQNGYLNITASKSHDQEEKDEEDNIIRQERYYGTMSRSFYVGDGITADDVRGKFEDGVLTLTIPKKEPIEKLDNPNRISID